VLAAEVRLLRWSVLAFAVQVLLLGAVLFGLGIEPATVLVTVAQGVILAGLLWWHGRHGAEEGGPAFGPAVIGAVLLGMAALYACQRLDPLVTMGAALAAVGAWTLLTHRDPFKLVMSICLAENGVHAVLVGLAPQLPETVEVAIAAAVILAVWLLLFTGRRLKGVGA
jgi:hydrogenase-4 membrane subunit HyfE